MQVMNKILQGHKYVANFIDEPVRLGMIYRMDDDQFIPVIHFSDAYPEIDLTTLIDSGSTGSIKFSVAEEVTISFGADASSRIGESEVKLKFNKSRSVAGVIQDAVVHSLRYGNLLSQLEQIWSDRGYVKHRDGYVFVFEVLAAASGTLIYSQDSKNEVVLKHTLGNPVTKLADLGSGNFERISSTKHTLEMIRNVAHKPLFKAFSFRKDWQPEILG